MAGRRDPEGMALLVVHPVVGALRVPLGPEATARPARTAAGVLAARRSSGRTGRPGPPVLGTRVGRRDPGGIGLVVSPGVTAVIGMPGLLGIGALLAPTIRKTGRPGSLGSGGPAGRGSRPGATSCSPGRSRVGPMVRIGLGGTAATRLPAVRRIGVRVGSGATAPSVTGPAAPAGSPGVTGRPGRVVTGRATAQQVASVRTGRSAPTGTGGPGVRPDPGGSRDRAAVRPVLVTGGRRGRPGVLGRTEVGPRVRRGAGGRSGPRTGGRTGPGMRLPGRVPVRAVGRTESGGRTGLRRSGGRTAGPGLRRSGGRTAGPSGTIGPPPGRRSAGRGGPGRGSRHRRTSTRGTWRPRCGRSCGR